MRIHEEVRKMPVSPIRTWTSRLHDLSPRAELTLGEPPQITDSRIIEAAKTALDQGLTHYPPAAGLQSLRQELAKRERQLRGWTIHPHQVLVTDGAQEALAVCCLALLNPGDEVLISDPGYPGTRSVISLASAVPVACAADEHLQLDITRMASDQCSYAGDYRRQSEQSNRSGFIRGSLKSIGDAGGELRFSFDCRRCL